MSSYSFVSPGADDTQVAAAAYAYETKAYHGYQGFNKASFSVNHILDLEELPKNHAMFANGPTTDNHELAVNMVGGGGGVPGRPTINNPSSCLHVSPTQTEEAAKSPIGKFVNFTVNPIALRK